MRKLQTLLMLIMLSLIFTIGQPAHLFAQGQAMNQQYTSHNKTPPPNDQVLAIDSINGTSMPIPYEFYETQIVGHWGNRLCIAPSNNVDDMRCTKLKVKQVIDDGEEIFVVLAYQMALNDQANTYSNRGRHHDMWFGQPCGGGWIKGFVYHAGLPGAQTENIDHLPPPFPGLDVC